MTIFPPCARRTRRTLLLTSVGTLAWSCGLLTGCARDDRAYLEREFTPEQMQAMGEVFQRYQTPGTAHRTMADQFVGEWEVRSEFWMMPESDPQVTVSTARTTPIMGGRYLREDVTGSFMGREWQGMSLTGYDNALGEYTYLWIDDMGTGMASGTGTYDPATKTYTYFGEMTDAMEQAMLRTKSVITMQSDDRHVFEMFGEAENGEWLRMMRLTYERAG